MREIALDRLRIAASDTVHRRVRQRSFKREDSIGGGPGRPPRQREHSMDMLFVRATKFLGPGIGFPVVVAIRQSQPGLIGAGALFRRVREIGFRPEGKEHSNADGVQLADEGRQLLDRRQTIDP